MKLLMKVISNKPEMIDNIPSVWGEIIIGDFKETFVIPLEYWTLKDYERQWKDALEKIKKNTKSILITAVQDPAKAPFIEWWPMYRYRKKIYIRNNIIFGEFYKKKIGNKLFTPETCYDFVPDRTTKFSKGIKPSEWVINLP